MRDLRAGRGARIVRKKIGIEQEPARQASRGNFLVKDTVKGLDGHPEEVYTTLASSGVFRQKCEKYAHIRNLPA